MKTKETAAITAARTVASAWRIIRESIAKYVSNGKKQISTSLCVVYVHVYELASKLIWRIYPTIDVSFRLNLIIF